MKASTLAAPTFSEDDGKCFVVRSRDLSTHDLAADKRWSVFVASNGQADSQCTFNTEVLDELRKSQDVTRALQSLKPA